MEVWNKVEVHPGDVFFIQAGTIHAIGAGILICEIQQNSNCTYRVYDYDRRGADGRPRELHIEKALDVCRLEPSETAGRLGEVKALAGGTVQQLGGVRISPPKGSMWSEALTLEVGEDSFVSLLATDGSGWVEARKTSWPFVPGTACWCLPAGGEGCALPGRPP